MDAWTKAEAVLEAGAIRKQRGNIKTIKGECETMINYHKQIVNSLKTILPTHYEMILHKGINTPCISYLELNNSANETGDTLGYSSIQYQIKVWGNDIGDLQNYALKIDNTLRPLGWKRIGCRELYDKESTMIQKVMTYEAKALEVFKEE